MRGPLRLALEVQPARPGGDRGADEPFGFAALAALLPTATAAGFDTVWVAPGVQGAPAGPHRWADQTTLAGGLAAVAGELVVGVMASPAEGRQPSVLAREVTTLDVLSGGRAALLLGGLPSAGSPSAVPLAVLAEAVGVCHALFTQDRVTVSGATYRLDDAVNRPRPVRAGGPLLAVQLPEDPATLEAFLGSVDGLVVEGGEAHVVAHRRALDAALARAGPTSGNAGGLERPPVLVWRGVLDRDPEDAATTAGALLAAGAEGLIVRAGPGRPTWPAGWLTEVGQAVRRGPDDG